MQLVYQADNLFDAHMVKHALEDAGIPAFVLGESLLGGMGELPLFGVLRVCVPDSAGEQAQAVIAALVPADLAGDDADPIWEEGTSGILPA
ncbi:DUF2007 domain-containing protein [Stenotrophomonas sp. Marseille-Q4652]|uniref:putative signal transducing protein n=1 Tax=Stenotrophomonas sp. Marseille-Q4652 TaxID=2866595 RepID=UPI001CE43384|nr:DUF2007 domain-containing protein [Stenotrophomonas sp. Marseille-Q4652]